MYYSFLYNNFLFRQRNWLENSKFKEDESERFKENIG